MSIPSPSASTGYLVRAPERADGASIAALMVEAETALYGESDAGIEDVHFIWGWPRFDLSRDAWLVVAPAGKVVGHAWVWGPRLPDPAWDGRLHLSPFAAAADLAGLLIPRMEARVHERVAETGTTGPASLAIPSSSIDHRKLEILRDRGYRPIRTFFRMERPLAETPGLPAPRWPPGVEVSAFRPGIDEADVHDAIQDSFADHFRFMPESLEDWSPRAYGHADFAPELTFLVCEGRRVVAVSVNYQIAGDGWIGMLGVRRAWRHRGLATGLLYHSFAAFRAAGCPRAVLGVDSENADGATRLYETVGMRVTRREQLNQRVVG